MRSFVLAILGVLIPSGVLAQEHDMKVVVDFSETSSVPWSMVNDRVMGGRSTSDLTLTAEGTGVFSGFVSLENNGGFASMRGTFRTLDLSSYRGVTLRVRGDGRPYQLRMRMNGSFDGVAYGAEFETNPGDWMEVHLPFEDFQATYRGRSPRGVGPLDPGSIRQMGILIGDKKEGPFRLEIAWIKTLESGDPDHSGME